jgi:hypothetical protein
VGNKSSPSSLDWGREGERGRGGDALIEQSLCARLFGVLHQWRRRRRHRGQAMGSLRIVHLQPYEGKGVERLLSSTR